MRLFSRKNVAQERLDKAIRKERQERYKMLRKVFQARDAASKYVKRTVKVSTVLYGLTEDTTLYYSAEAIAKIIVDRKGILFSRPPKPPVQAVTKKEPQPPEFKQEPPRPPLPDLKPR